MKKTLLSIAFVAAGLFAFNASAQDACVTPENCNNTENCQTPCKGDRGAKMLEGLNLTPEQQAAVKALHQKKAEARKAAKQEKKDAAKQSRKDAADARRDYLNQMKSILTPDQYVVFLENIAVYTPANNGPQGHKAPKDMKRDGKKGDRKGDRTKGPKGQKCAPGCNGKTKVAETK